MASVAGAPSEALPATIGGRYLVQTLLGRGGMARVYRVADPQSEHEVALKQLMLPSDEAARRQVEALFEREFHTLAELSHPRVIEVYDYGIDAAGPYYTMELLDGGDLRTLSPLAWRRACELIFDVCSSLALLHSRRLVHRDVSPRNVRCTRDGHAKLIDFGAMASMGAGGHVVGTPAFVAPEVLHRSMLDARTDLFSLGGTLYYTLTGRTPFTARDFNDLLDAWSQRPLPPSAIAHDVPKELDELVLSMLNVTPALRPRSAFEVMQRLAQIGGFERDEPLSVAQAYLSTPTLVGRDRMLAVVRRRMARALHGRGRGVLIEGRPGLGRSRVLDACVLEAKMLGATVLRASAAGVGGSSFAVAQMLGEQLLQALPEAAIESAREAELGMLLLDGERGPRLRPLGAPDVQPMQIQSALLKWILAVSRLHPIAVAVDDVHHIDESSAALLALLADKGRHHPLLVVATVGEDTAGARVALSVLRRRSARWTLTPLERGETEQLLGSVFGDVPNLGLLSERIHAVATGNPRTTLELAQHLVDKGLIRYERGVWTLPAALGPADLPRSAEAAARTRLASLGELARFFADVHALAFHDGLAREDYALLRPDADGTAIDTALTGLLAKGVLTSADRQYVLAHRGWVATITSEIDPDALGGRHRALAALHDAEGGMLAAHHLLEGGLHARALEMLGSVLKETDDAGDLAGALQDELARFAPTVDRALDVAIALQRPPREIQRLRRWLSMLSVISDERYYFRAAPEWRRQLEIDSGLTFFRELPATDDPGQRLMAALVRARQRYEQLPEHERTHKPEEAIPLLVRYVAISIAIGAWAFDAELLRSLPGLLEPFEALSPAIRAVLQNARATIEMLCDIKPEKARERWRQVFEELSGMSPSELPYVDVIRGAVAYGVGAIEARLGLPTASSWVEVLDAEPLQRVNAMYLRRTIELQQGDWDEADRFRRRAEVLALQTSARQMFNTSALLELASHAFAGHLEGLKQTAQRIEVHAARHPGWATYRELAEGMFQRHRGDLEAACAAFERSLALCRPDRNDEGRGLLAWPTATAGYVDVLLALGRTGQALAVAERALAICNERGIALGAYDVVRALALAEGKAGMHESAGARLDRLLAEQMALGITGLHLGASHEARARVALYAGDSEAFQMHARLAAHEYRHGTSSPLGVRYERLMDEARRVGVAPPGAPEGTGSGTSAVGPTRSGTVVAVATKAMREAGGAPERALRALQLLCGTHGATAGHLFLFGERGLVLAASQGAAPDTDGLREYLHEYLAREHEELSMATTDLTAANRTAVTSKPHWTDLSGRMLRPVVLTCMVAGTERHAGVATLLLGMQRGRERGEAMLATTLASLLIEAGDTTGLPTASCGELLAL